MTAKTENLIESQLRKDLSEMKVGDRVKLWQKIKEKNKERVTPFEGIVIAKKHGKGITATVTIRGEVKGVGVEKIFPIHSPTIDHIEILAHHKVRRAKLYYLRTAKGKRARLKRIKEKTPKNKK